MYILLFIGLRKMEPSEEIDYLGDILNNFTFTFKFLSDKLRQLKDKDVNKSLIEKSEKYLKNATGRTKKVKKAYEEFTKQIEKDCNKLVNSLNLIEEEDQKEVEKLKKDLREMIKEMDEKNKELSKVSLDDNKEPSFIYFGGKKSKVDVQLAKQYPGSYFYKEYMSDRRMASGDVFIDFDGEDDELVVKYMNDDESLIDDLKKMSDEGVRSFLSTLSLLSLPVKRDFILEIRKMTDKFRNIMKFIHEVSYGMQMVESLMTEMASMFSRNNIF